MAKIISEFNDSLYFSYTSEVGENFDHSYVLGKLALIICHQGYRDVMVNDVLYRLDPQHMLFLHPHAEIKSVAASSDSKFTVIGFMMGLQESFFQQIDPSFFTCILKQPCWNLNEKQQTAVQGFAHVFDYTCNHVEDSLKTDMISELFTVFLRGFYIHTKHLYHNPEVGNSFSGRNIVGRFTNLLAQNYKQHHNVTFYADALCISPKYLTQVLKKDMGITPKDIIDRRIAIECLYLLGKTPKTIQEISFILGFPDQSYFGRYFKRMFGISPLMYRQNPSLDLMKKLNIGSKLEIKVSDAE